MAVENQSEEELWLLAAEWADANGADIINTSLGYTADEYFPFEMDGETSIISKAANLAAKKGILVVCSAGNSGTTKWKYIATPADAALMMQLGAETVFVGSGIFMSEDPELRAKAVVEATTHYQDPDKVMKASTGLKGAMKGLDMSEIPENERLQERGW